MRLELLYCGHVADVEASGKAIDRATGWQMCQQCAADVERDAMIRTGVAGLYLVDVTGGSIQRNVTSRDRMRVTDWLGGLSFPVLNYRHSKHGGGFGAQREDFDFHGPDGYVWHGTVRGDMQLARCKRTKKRSKTARILCYDNGGTTADRYTVVYLDMPENGDLYSARGMNAYPFHPQGIGMMTTAMPGRHLGKRIKFTDLPADCQRLVNSDLES